MKNSRNSEASIERRNLEYNLFAEFYNWLIFLATVETRIKELVFIRTLRLKFNLLRELS